MGFAPSSRKLSMKSFVSSLYQNLFLNLGSIFRISSFHLSNFKRIVRSKLLYVHETRYPKSKISLCKVSLTHPS